MMAAEKKRELLALLDERDRRRAESRREARKADLALHRDDIRDRCRSLIGFVCEAWHILEPRADLVIGWHMEAICKHLEAVTDGRITRLLINVPPGSSKSLLVSVLWPAWEWAMGHTDMRYLNTSYSDIPVKRDSGKMRDLILSEWYQALFPHVKLKKTGETSFSNTNTGVRQGVPFGSLTSQRGDRLIIDDPHSTETAESDLERQRTTRRFREGALDRLNDLEKSAIVVIMQRLHEADVSGVILGLPELGFVHINIPMKFDPDKKCVVKLGEHPEDAANDNRPIFWQDPRTKRDELMDPKRFPANAVRKLEIGKGSYAFSGQYQQAPVPRGGGLFKEVWFKTIKALPKLVRIVRSWDFASTEDAGDWTVGLLMGVTKDGDYIIMGCKRFQGSPFQVELTFKNLAALDGKKVFVRYPQDPGQAGVAQAQAFAKHLAGHRFRYVRPTGSKYVRAEPLAAQAEAGNVYLFVTGNPDRDAWIDPFLAEMTVFPKGKNDDIVDAISDGFDELANYGSGYALAEAMGASGDGEEAA